MPLIYSSFFVVSFIYTEAWCWRVQWPMCILSGKQFMMQPLDGINFQLISDIAKHATVHWWAIYILNSEDLWLGFPVTDLRRGTKGFLCVCVFVLLLWICGYVMVTMEPRAWSNCPEMHIMYVVWSLYLWASWTAVCWVISETAHDTSIFHNSPSLYVNLLTQSYKRS